MKRIGTSGMNKLIKIESKLGFIDVFTNEEKDVIYAIPNGYVGPELVKKDLEFLRYFDANCTDEWKYVVDISKVKVVNPVNPFLLGGLKELSKMSEYIVYSPSPIVRLMLKLTSWLNKPDKIIKDKEALQSELQNETKR